MNPAFPFAPERASSLAGEVDTLFLFILGVTGLFAVGVWIALLFFAIRYRRRSDEDRPPEIHGSLVLELTWTIVPLLLMAVMFVWGAKVYFHMNRPPDDAMSVSVVGKRWMWKLQHPTGQREINELHVPRGRAVKLVITSEDTIHSFFVPAFRIKKDAVPGRYNTAWFRATRNGSYHLFCAEYCGTEHSKMIGRVVVMEPEAYETWLAGGPPPESPVAAGEKLFTELNCITCHRPDSAGRGPFLAGIFGRPVKLADGRHRAGGRGLRPRVDRQPGGPGRGGLPAGDADLPGAGERGAADRSHRLHPLAAGAPGGRGRRTATAAAPAAGRPRP